LNPGGTYTVEPGWYHRIGTPIGHQCPRPFANRSPFISLTPLRVAREIGTEFLRDGKYDDVKNAVFIPRFKSFGGLENPTANSFWIGVGHRQPKRMLRARHSVGSLVYSPPINSTPMLKPRPNGQRLPTIPRACDSYTNSLRKDNC